MSGQRLLKPTDAPKFRQQYLANLALQAKNNDVNLQANKLFKRTGQIPIPPSDTRTTAEKYEDIQRLKIELRQGLKEIMDGINTERVVQQLDTNELIYLSNRLPDVIRILKPKYKNGILATPFIIFLRKYEADEMRNVGVQTGLQQASGRDVLLGINQILDNMVDRDDLTALTRIMTNETGKISQQLLQDIDDLRSVIPSEDMMRGLNQLKDEQAKQEVEELINRALEDVPTKQGLATLILDFQTAQNKRDRAQMGVVLGQLREILQVQREQKEQIRLAEEIIRTASKGQSEGEPLGEAEAYMPEMSQEREPTQASATLTDIPATKAKGVRVWDDDVGYIPPDEFGTYNIGEMKKYIRAINKTYNKGDGSLGMGYVLGQRYTNTDLTNGKAETLKTLEIVKRRDKDVRAFWEQKQSGKPSAEPAEGKEEEPAEEGKEEGKGKGLSRKMKGRGVGYKNNKEEFGDVLIHKPKLDNDIISIRKLNGSSVFKSKLVSNKLGNVVRLIHAKKIPSYDDYKDLSEDEKMYLHKLVKASGLMEKLNIPSPSKDEEAQDKNDFEICRGQILSGNDSPVVIKRFKVLIIKMMKRELISGSEGKELLYELLALGF
jgi:hypothetical protein